MKPSVFSFFPHTCLTYFFRKRLAMVLVVVVTSITSIAQKPYTANTVTFDASGKTPNYSIDDISWIAGRWRGVDDSTIIEEHWMKPEGHNMVGMFRMVQGGNTLFYELMTIFQTNNMVSLRLKHFNRNMKGWEHKDSTGVSFPLLKVEGKKAYFDGQTYQLLNKNTLIVYLAESAKNGTVKEEVFKYKRMK